MLRSFPANGAALALGALFLLSGPGCGPSDSQTGNPEVPPSPSTAGTLEGVIRYDGAASGPVVVNVYPLLPRGSGGFEELSKADLLGGRQPDRTQVLPKGPGPFRFEGLLEGQYSVVAFLDLDEDGILDFGGPGAGAPHGPEPLGWYAAEAAAWIDPIDLPQGGVGKADVTLRAPRPFPREERRTDHGALRWKKGLPVLQLQGTAQERGFAHGFLVGEQIVDFFEFYVLEDSWGSARRYEGEFVPFLETHFDYDPAYLAEVDAVVEGMKASGMDMGVGWLGRDFRRVDLLAINAYIERRAAQPSPPAPTSPVSSTPPSTVSWAPPEPTDSHLSSTPSPSPPSLTEWASALPDGPACTQFAFWGEATQGSELAGGLIAGRNMDGEVDLRKVTVSHFLLFAVDPAEPGLKRWVSAMWPGFVGTISGINEEGLYSMENAGGSGPGPVVDGLTPCSWVQRNILENAGGESSPESIGQDMDAFRSGGGGTFGAGSIILWAVPYRGQPTPAFVSEGDRFGTAVRGPSEVAPMGSYDIMATNHYMTYGVDPDRPGFFFGKEASFSSLWRYETGMNTLEAWARQKKVVGTEDMRRLLQSVAHGTTEYSVIFRANQMTLDVAVDDLAADLWDAPYQAWTTFGFEELFEGME